MTSHTSSHSSMEQRIDAVRLSESDRRLAQEHMHEADVFADLVYRAAENLRSTGEFLSGLFARRAR